MQLTENTTARWESVIADLSAKANRYETELAELTLRAGEWRSYAAGYADERA